MNLQLNRGRDRAESIGAIAERHGLSRRAVEKELERLVQVLPIVACPTGVYVATSPQEARQYASSLKGRIVAVQARISALERWADGVEVEQTRLPWSEAA